MEDSNAVLAAYDWNSDGYVSGSELDSLMADMRTECGGACPDGLNVADFDGDKDGKFDFWDVWGLCFTVAINKAFYIPM